MNTNIDPSMSNEVSIYGQNDTAEDFPVLKAFQQYIDAEQAKARRRMLTMAVFFGAFLILVVALFIYLLHGVNQRNQQLNDRLVEYAMTGRASGVVANPQNEAAMKAMTETLVKLQAQMDAKEKQSAVNAANAAANTAAHDRKVAEETAKLRRTKELLDEEKRKLAAEKERLHAIEVDRQRRKLYPELYEEKKQPVVAPKQTAQPQIMLTAEDIKDILREAYAREDAEDAADEAEESKPKAKAKAKAKSKAKAKTKAVVEEVESEGDEEAEDDDAIEYFKDDEYTIPVDVKGKGSKVTFTLPID